MKEDDVRRRLARVAQPDRILNAESGWRTVFDVEPPGQELGETIYAMKVGGTNRRHGDESAVEQFDAIVLGQDAGLGHPMTLVDGQGPLSGRERVHVRVGWGSEVYGSRTTVGKDTVVTETYELGGRLQG